MPDSLFAGLGSPGPAGPAGAAGAQGPGVIDGTNNAGNVSLPASGSSGTAVLLGSVTFTVVTPGIALVVLSADMFSAITNFLHNQIKVDGTIVKPLGGEDMTHPILQSSIGEHFTGSYQTASLTVGSHTIRWEGWTTFATGITVFNPQVTVIHG